MGSHPGPVQSGRGTGRLDNYARVPFSAVIHSGDGEHRERCSSDHRFAAVQISVKLKFIPDDLREVA
jgi:hypothetical protein